MGYLSILIWHPRKLTGETVWPEVTSGLSGQTVTVKVTGYNAVGSWPGTPTATSLKVLSALLGSADDGDVVSLPHYGSVNQKLPACWKTNLDKLVRDGKSGLYYQCRVRIKVVDLKAMWRAWVNNAQDTPYSTGKTVDRSSVVLGTAENAERETYLVAGCWYGNIR